METALSEPISPELALVCPELRAMAIAQLVELDRVRARPPSREYALMRAIDSGSDEQTGRHEERDVSLPVAILAYTAGSTVKLAVEAAALVGLLVGALSIVAFLHA